MINTFINTLEFLSKWVIFSLALSFIIQLDAADAAWASTAGGNWNLAGNWTTGGPPNAPNAVASFSGLPTTAIKIIDTTANVTIGSLHLDVNKGGGSELDISFGFFTLTFDQTDGTNARLFSGSEGTGIINLLDATTPIILNSTLDIFNRQAGILQIEGLISGAGGINYYGASSGTPSQFNLISGAVNNTFAGAVSVFSGILSLGTTNATVAIPGNISVFQQGSVTHTANFLYSSFNSMTINGGVVDLAGTTQSISNLTIQNGGILTNSASGGLLNLGTLLGNSIVLATGGSIQNSVPTMQIDIHGATIAYDATNPGTAFIGLNNPVVIDLGITSTNISVPHNSLNCVDLESVLATYQNGILNKTGNGVLLFQSGAVPTFNVTSGTVIIGNQASPFPSVTANGPVTVSSGAILAGFKTLIATAGVVNSGTVQPGSPCDGCSALGTLTITGNYTQTATGTLAINALSTAAHDLLVVQTGNVSLGGVLSFNALEGSTLAVGDQVLVLDNSTGALPISGTFSSLLANIPPQLNASIIYDPPNRVLVQLSACDFCPPCPTSTSSLPSMKDFVNLFAASEVLINETHIQQRWRMTAWRQDLFSRCLAEEAEEDPCHTVCKNTHPKNQLSLYVGGLGGFGDVNRASDQLGYDFSAWGGLIGTNYWISRGGIGGEVGYEAEEADVDKDWGDFRLQSAFLSIYGTFSPCNHFFFDLAVENRYNWYHINRHTSNGTAEARTSGYQWDIYLDLGYDIYRKGLVVTPLVSFEYDHLYIDDYSEHDAGLQNVHVEDQSFNSYQSWLGLSLGKKIISRCFTVIPGVRGFWIHEFGQLHHHLRVKSKAFNTSRKLKLVNEGKNYGLLGADLSLVFWKNFYLDGSYDHYWNRDIHSNLFYLELGTTF